MWKSDRLDLSNGGISEELATQQGATGPDTTKPSGDVTEVRQGTIVTIKGTNRARQCGDPPMRGQREGIEQ